MEETFFRGFLQPRIGILASSLLFVLAHWTYGEPFMLVGVALLSLTYALLTRWRGSVWAAAAAHAVFDGVQLLVLVPLAMEQLAPERTSARRSAPARRGALVDWRPLERGETTVAMAPDELQFRLTIDSRFENIELVQVVLNDTLERLGLADDTRHWVDLATREAVANAIKHGNRGAADKNVEIEMAVAGEEVVLRIADQGSGFDPGGVGDPLSPENLLRPSGRGLFYMQSFMDEVTYEGRSGRRHAGDPAQTGVRIATGLERRLRRRRRRMRLQEETR